ncbi:ribonuclease R [Marinihelvus fidelis]|uniref:Ribonuclease R n=1 Tax=Marinihelvus fidelis TaxID=2613842 RepID=A0A5N0TF63_9GAMM|nr:ribonuclease R [Marinihelvus fidelis]KAA9133104.1 ribonuclease R [Marinihelvus fidelis]
MSKHENNNPGHIDAEAPDRQAILDCLEREGRPLKRGDIVHALGVESADSREILRRRLKAMVRDGQLIKNRRGAYGVAAKMDLVSGRVTAHPDGYGFLVPEDGGEDLYLSSRQMRSVLHGDRVLASVIGVDHRGRREGKVKEVLERANQTVVGRFVEESGVALVVPDETRISQDVLIPLKDTGGAKPGQIVVAAIINQPTEKQPPVGKIVQVLGEMGAPGMATDIAIHNFGIPYQWPDGVEAEAKAFGDVVPEAMKEGRKDLRDLPLVTIDGADARDFDDAVYAQRQRKGWRLVVTIADVASYVKPGGLLDVEAVNRGTSVYFPNRVVPMLPEALSNGLCSLKPREDRLCLACDMTVDERGQVTRSRFVAAVMHSHARLTYGQVWRYLDEGDIKLDRDADAIRANLDDLHALYKVLKKARRQRGAIDFESQEVKFAFDENGEVADLLPTTRNDAHKLIEECMIMANVEAARFLQQTGLPAPYRVHAPPPMLKLESLTQFLQAQGLKPTWRDQPEPRDFDRIAQQAKGRPDEKLIMAVLLRSQSLAVYLPENNGHFGLALDAYSHFTSPIRRYPDLLAHRAIHHAIARQAKAEFPYGKNDMQKLCEGCSHRERRAEEAERDVDDRLKCAYMEQHIGMEFNGIVSGVTSFGLFVELDHGNVNGLVHVTNLPNDYYHFDPVSHSLTGERRGRVFQLADPVRVSVEGVNVEERKIDFELAES